MNHRRLILLMLAAGPWWPGGASTSVAQCVRLESGTVDAGGEIWSEGSDAERTYRLGATIGQPAVAELAGGVFRLQNGFWQTEWPDCNGNAVEDRFDIALLTSKDCNGNFVPDECDLAFGGAQDCNSDGRLDECEFEPHWSDAFRIGAEPFDDSTSILELAVYDDGVGPALYVGGYAMTAMEGEPVGNLAQWDGQTWSAVGDAVVGEVFDLAVWDPDGCGPEKARLCVAHSGTDRFSMWDGTAWEHDNTGPNRAVLAHDIDQDGIAELYGGTASGGNFVQWSGSAWSPVDADVDGPVTELGLFDADGDGPNPPVVVVVGEFNEAGTGLPSPHVVFWDGADWSSPDGGITGGYTPRDVIEYDDDHDGPNPPHLYLAASGGHSLKRWDGVNWTDVPGFGAADSGVYGLCVHDPDDKGPELPALYVLGGFSTPTSPGNNIARWDGTSWSGFGEGFCSGRAYTGASFDPDGTGPLLPDLYIGGSFLSVEGRASRHLAKWGNADNGASLDCDGATLDACEIAIDPGLDCNDNGLPDACDLDPGRAEFGRASSWTAYDPGVGAIGQGYWESIFDGRYLYFAPFYDGSAYHGEVLRYDTQSQFDDDGSWTAYDPGGTGVAGYKGGAFDGRFVYFAPFYNGTATSARVLRYDTTAPFDSGASWATFDAGATPVNARGGYSGAVFDGEQYVYFVPERQQNPTLFHGEVLRYDTLSDFSSSSSWTKYDPPVGAHAEGYHDAVVVGDFVYFCPYKYGNQTSSTFHGEVLRYNRTGSFTESTSWAAYEPDSSWAGYTGVVSDGAYLYFAPFRNPAGAHGQVLRYNLGEPFDELGSWTAFDTEAARIGFNTTRRSGAAFDGRYVYFPPSYAGSGRSATTVRYDANGAFEDSASWDTFEPLSCCLGTRVGYWGSAFDGRHLYFVPHIDWVPQVGYLYHGEVMRYDTQAGWLPDCQPNLIPDECESAEPGGDCNANSVPDDCETIQAGDFDADGRVDLEDHVFFVDCVAGPGASPNPAVTECAPACLAAFDADTDGDVDVADFAELQRVLDRS